MGGLLLAPVSSAFALPFFSFCGRCWWCLVLPLPLPLPLPLRLSRRPRPRLRRPPPPAPPRLGRPLRARRLLENNTKDKHAWSAVEGASRKRQNRGAGLGETECVCALSAASPRTAALTAATHRLPTSRPFKPVAVAVAVAGAVAKPPPRYSSCSAVVSTTAAMRCRKHRAHAHALARPPLAVLSTCAH